jgi:hypothetical protein
MIDFLIPTRWFIPIDRFREEAGRICLSKSLRAPDSRAAIEWPVDAYRDGLVAQPAEPQGFRVICLLDAGRVNNFVPQVSVTTKDLNP